MAPAAVAAVVARLLPLAVLVAAALKPRLVVAVLVLEVAAVRPVLLLAVVADGVVAAALRGLVASEILRRR